MHKLLLAAASLLPLVGSAQSFAPGLYILFSNRTVRHRALLQLVRRHKVDKLKVKRADGKMQEFTPFDVHSLQIGNHKYRSMLHFGIGQAEVEGGFIEQADSGQVVLFKYDYVSGSYISGPTVTHYVPDLKEAVYFLQRPADTTPIQLTYNFLPGAGTEFYTTLLPYLMGRPDLIQLVEQKRITADNIPGLIHALNTGAPYSPTKFH